MIPRLYLSDSIEFESNGEGLLKDIMECYVEEERNGLFDLTFKIPVSSFLFEKIEKGNIVKAHASDRLKNQLFRIDIITKPIDNIVIVYAKHISFDLDKDFIVKLIINNQSCEYVLNEIFSNSKFSKHFKGKSDIVNTQDYNIELVSPLEAIGGKEGSVIDTFGNSTDILRDNFTISVLNDRGKHNNVLLAYRKNITGFELVEDIENVVGDIYPYAEYSNENNETIRVTIDEEYVTSPRKVNYKFPTKILPKDFSEKFENDEVPTQDKLRQLSKKYFTESKCDIPKLSYKIEFIPLSKTENYKDMKFLEDIGMCDKVLIWNSKYNIRDEAKVIKTKYNVLTEKYESIELGEPKTTLGDIVNRLPDQGPPGKPGPMGPQGEPGQDGKPGEEFPDTLPTTPIVTLRAGFDSIGVSWTFESKVYYNYEVYASQTKDFNPNSFDLIFKGQSSAFLHEVLPNQTWYYRVCAINSYGSRTTFSEQVSATTTKIADGTEYFDNAAIKDALIADLRADRAWIGKFQGEYIDARNLSVTDGNGKRTLDIDSFGNVNLDVTSLNIKNEKIENFYNKGVVNLVPNSTALNNTVGWLNMENCTIKRIDTNTTSTSRNMSKIHFFERAGDTILIEDIGGKTILVDGGYDTEIEWVIDYMRNKLNIVSIDYVLATHSHSDHIGGTPAIINAFGCQKLFIIEPDWSKMPSEETEWKTKEYYNELITKANQLKTEIIRPSEGMKVALSVDSEIIFYNTNCTDYSDYNNISYGFKYNVGQNKLFLAGDMTKVSEANVKGQIGQVDFLKLGHHGTGSSSGTEFIKELQPRLAMFTSAYLDDGSIGSGDIHKRLCLYDGKSYSFGKTNNTIVTFLIDRLSIVCNGKSFPNPTKGWFEDYPGGWYYFENGETVKSKWIIEKNIYYYFDSNGLMARNKFIMSGDKENYYFVNDKGYMITTAWKEFESEWYYFDNNGVMYKDKWLNDRGSYFYFKSDGKMAKNETLTIDNVEYTFDENGAMQ